MTTYAIGLGSNLGDRLENLRYAVTELGRVGAVMRVSSVYETAPMGGPEQGHYLNAVVLVGVEEDPDSMLAICHSIESGAGRVREEPWGPRTLDLDLIASDTTTGGRAVLPHPRAAEREFVLRPLCEVWPEAIVAPGLTAREALAAIGHHGVDRLARVWLTPETPALARWLVVVQFSLLGLVALAMTYDGSVVVRAEVSRLVGVGLSIIGVVVAVSATRRLDTAFTPNPEPRPGSSLVDHGPYRYVRHPIYSGLVLLALGGSAAVASWAGLAGSGVLIVFFLVKIAYEERRLRMRYAGYRDYMRRVRGRIVPFLL
ncbi:MAG: 2-amino-4-hydroxy-6-hydroxymethyldihydropteridine diphosphokinase [Actinobacteria bacterium]|nr:2-amino-4-hydroxy-6-hydroxymethyldihydropteridine diphosphokinase [Actinomycetota bacterium]